MTFVYYLKKIVQCLYNKIITMMAKNIAGVLGKTGNTKKIIYLH